MVIPFLLDAVAARPDHPALSWDGGTELTYEELVAAVTRRTQDLLRHGMAHGDTIALLQGNGPGFVIDLLAVWSLGGVAAPMALSAKPQELRDLVAQCAARGVLVDRPDRGHSLPDLDVEVPPIEEPIAYARGGSADLVADDTPDAPALFQWSSGSTGLAKAVIRTQANLVAEAQQYGGSVGLSPDARVLAVVPLHHAHGLGNALIASIHAGATLVVMEGFERRTTARVVRQQRVSCFPGVPFMFDILARTPGVPTDAFRSLDLCFSAGGPLPRATFDAMLERFGVPVRQLYGCTEGGALTMNLDPDPDATATSVGRPLQGVTVEVVDDDGGPAPEGANGDIVVRSPSLADGYVQPGDGSLGGGEFRTGDVGRIGPDGHLYLTGRKKLYISTPVHKVAPEEVEAVLMRHPAIREAVVVGVPSGAHELVKAVIVADEDLSTSAVVAHCREVLADHKVPRLVEVVEEIPKSPLGKTLRKHLV